MDFAKLAQISVGLAAFLGGLWIVLLIIRSIKKNGNENHKSAGLTAEEWKIEIRRAVKEVLVETTPQRHQELEKLFERVFNHKFLERDRELRKLIHDELERWEKE